MWAREIQGELCWINPDEKERLDAAGYTDLSRVYRTRDLAGGNNIFFVSTAVTNCRGLRGVRFLGNGRVATNTLVMRTESGTIRNIEAVHDMTRKDLTNLIILQFRFLCFDFTNRRSDYKVYSKPVLAVLALEIKTVKQFNSEDLL